MTCAKCNKIFKNQTYRKQKCNECRAEEKLIRDKIKNEKPVKTKEEIRKINLENVVLKSRLKYPDGSDPNAYVECGICGFRSNNLGTHLKVHNITSTEHKEKYGPVISVNSREKMKGENNPAFNHGGKFSPFSKKFIYYKSDEAIAELVKTAHTNMNENNNNPCRLDYYIKRGATEAEAIKLLGERQTTFSLETCQEKYGLEEGLIRWQERQDKWQDNLKSKPDEEIERINSLKSCKINFKTLWSRELNDPGNFYILELTENMFKIGITSKPRIEMRHGILNRKNNTIKVKYFVPMKNISHAFKIEQLLKHKFSHTISLKECKEYAKIGWTEILHTNFENIISYVNEISDIETATTLFKKTFIKNDKQFIQ